jgi:hypothetical protein
LEEKFPEEYGTGVYIQFIESGSRPWLFVNPDPSFLRAEIEKT